MDPFDFGRFFRGFLGLGKRDEEVYSPIQRYNDREGDEIYQHEERGQEGDPNQNFFHFRVCTDPLGKFCFTNILQIIYNKMKIKNFLNGVGEIFIIYKLPMNLRIDCE